MGIHAWINYGLLRFLDRTGRQGVWFMRGVC